MRKHIVSTYWDKGQKLDLTKSYFRLLRTSTGALLIDSIWYNKKPLKNDRVYSYDEVKSMQAEFYVRSLKKYGFCTYKTFKGLMDRLQKETCKLEETF